MKEVSITEYYITGSSVIFMSSSIVKVVMSRRLKWFGRQEVIQRLSEKSLLKAVTWHMEEEMREHYDGYILGKLGVRREDEQN
jgi:hypothetical protein